MQVAPEMLSSSAGTPRPLARSRPPLLLRHVGHAQRVAPYLVPVARHPRVVGPALRWRECHPAVAAAGEVVVVAARLVLSLAVVDRPEKGVRQRPAPARAARQVEPVGPARFELDREPVLIARGPDGAGGRSYMLVFRFSESIALLSLSSSSSTQSTWLWDLFKKGAN